MFNLTKHTNVFAVRIFKFKYWNVKQIRQKSAPSTQTRTKIKHFIITSTHARMQAHQARDCVLGVLCVFSCKHVHLLMCFRAHVCFPENLAWLVFFKHPFWDSPFCLITNELHVTHSICIWGRYCYCHFVTSIPLFKERRKL